MQSFLTTFVFFIIMGLGWLMKRRGTLTTAGLKDINALLFSLLMPISFFKTGVGFDPTMLHGWRYATVLLSAYVIFTGFTWVVSGIVHRKAPLRRAVSIIATTRPNSIFLGVPLLALWAGQAGTEAQLVYIAVCLPYFNAVPLFLAIFASSGKADARTLVHSLWNTLKSPIILAGMLGILIGAMGWTHLIPDWATRTMNILGGCGSGLALIVIGAALAPENLRADISEAWPDMLLKLVLHPAAILIALVLFPMKDPVLMRCAVVATAIPPAFNCYMIARGFHMDSDYAADLVASTTLVSMVTLPIWMNVVSHIWP